MAMRVMRGGELAVGFVGEVAGGGFAFDGGGGGEDELRRFRCARHARRGELVRRSWSGPMPLTGESVPWRTW